VTADEITVLRLALACDGEGLPLRYHTIYSLMGEGRSYRALKHLRDTGALEHPGYNDWRITEKGRIAIALVNARPNSVDIGRAERATESHGAHLARDCGTVPSVESPKTLTK
jgi:hypothetical protein